MDKCINFKVEVLSNMVSWEDDLFSLSLISNVGVIR